MAFILCSVLCVLLGWSICALNHLKGLEVLLGSCPRRFPKAQDEEDESICADLITPSCESHRDAEQRTSGIENKHTTIEFTGDGISLTHKLREMHAAGALLPDGKSWKWLRKLMESSLHHLLLGRWGGFDHSHLALVSFSLILAWFAEVSLADPLTFASLTELETRVLRLGQERVQEKLPFKEGGQCVYELLDLKEAHSYEVKISYAASTPAIFSLIVLPELSKESSSSTRKLLNTEKIIFHVGKETFVQGTPVVTERRVLVTVVPAGVIGKPHVQEQEFIIYNIVSEEVILGIPMQALWVGCLGLMTILASIVAALQLIYCLQPREHLLTVKSPEQVL